VPEARGGLPDRTVRQHQSSFGDFRILLPLIALALSLGFTCIVPLGEAPDELAHIRYAERLARGRLPDPSVTTGDLYESHQPPLGYLPAALVIALRGGLDLNPSPNPGFSFQDEGRRAFLEPFARGRDALTLRAARATQAFWIALAVWATLGIVSDARAASPYLLAPQLLFLGGIVGNDAMLVALASCTLRALIGFVSTGRHPMAAGALATLCFFVKASGLFLLLPTLVAVALRFRAADGRRLSRANLHLLVTAGAGFLAWIGFHLLRTGAPVPAIPTAHRTASFFELFLEPRWIGSLFKSYWSNFGWLNLGLPAPIYVWFALLTLAAVVGLLRRGDPGAGILRSAVLANCGLLLAFLLFVDKQPQGRYLLPSVAALASAGSVLFPDRLRAPLFATALIVAAGSLAYLFFAYS
jgi:hypothetical protein